MPSKKDTKRQTLQFKYWKPILMKLSVAVNLIVLLFLIIFFIGYKTGNGYQTKKIVSLYYHQCYNFDSNTGPNSSKQETKVVNGKNLTAMVIRLTQAQLDSGCYVLYVQSAQSLYYQWNQGLLSKLGGFTVPVYLTPNGQLMEPISQLAVFDAWSK
jgi:hypothetical protein